MFYEPGRRIGLPTSSLPMTRSTTELPRLNCLRVTFYAFATTMTAIKIAFPFP